MYTEKTLQLTVIKNFILKKNPRRDKTKFTLFYNSITVNK